ncbi:MAG: 2-phospho-L-lactate guanylyltransferase [Candidatus Nanopelagicales bacterium]
MVHFIVPVKGFGRGKSRLRVPVSVRADLVEAMLLDTLSAIEAAQLGPAVVVSPDASLRRIAASRGAAVLDHPGGLNEAIRAAVDPGVNAAILPDLPALRPSQLQKALAGHETGLVPDWSGTGTTMLVGENLNPSFGPQSASRHAQMGYPLLDVPLCGLRADVDTHADLIRAAGLGLGEHTRAVMQRLGAGPAVRIGP